MSDFALALRAFGDKTMNVANNVTEGAITEFADKVEERTPVDTGFLRASWRLSIDAPAASGSGQFSFPDEVVGHVYYFTNSAAYARRIEHGFTGQDSLGRNYNQAGRGMVGLTVLEWDQIVRRNAAAAQVAGLRGAAQEYQGGA